MFNYQVVISVPSLRQTIYATANHDLALINSCKAGIALQEGTVEYWQAVLRNVEQAVKPRKRKKGSTSTQLTAEQKAKYRDAKMAYETKKFSAWIKDGHFIEPDYPDTGTSNGLTEFIIKYITWTGGRATRVSSAGRQLPNGKFIPSTTRPGASDVSSTIQGRSCMFEIKVGSDKPSPAQIKEQAKERAAGGEYFFTHNVEEFFIQYGSIVRQKELF